MLVETAFITNPDEMFSLDRFHPSAMGYKRTAKALIPSLLTALDFRPYQLHDQQERTPIGGKIVFQRLIRSS